MRTSLEQVPAAHARRMAAVPASAKSDVSWVDRSIDGFYGRIAVRETHGQGLPLVLIHGEGSSKEAFHLQMADGLGARHRLIAIDLPGHGGSDAVMAEGSSLTGLADAVIDAVEHLGIERFAVLGWSLGGYVALEVAAGAPGVVGVMVVGLPPADAIDVAACLKAVEPVAPSGSAGPAAWAADAAQASSAAVFGEIVADMADTPNPLGSLPEIPLAIVHGAKDPLLQGGHAEAPISARVWNNRPHAFPLSGRAPFRDAPEVFNATLGRFLHHLESGQRAYGRGACLAG